MQFVCSPQQSAHHNTPITTERRMANPNNYQFLEWDSQHFGLRIAACYWDGDVLFLSKVLATAKKEFLDLLYLFSPVDTVIPDDLLRQFSAIHCSGRVEFCKKIEYRDNAHRLVHENVIVLNKESCYRNYLRPLAVLAGKHSRFLTDPRLPKEKGEELFVLWADKSVTGERADIVFGALESTNKLVGFVTVRQEDNAARIGLIAVIPQEQRKGWGKALLQSAEHWARSRGLKQLRVATQAENTAACRFYTANGFEKQQCLMVYHLWFH